ncbi:RES family NAD+ phosphorylase [Rhodopila sp.]|jgi:RES domain-containing protein|uniref:RES family NAD+ phosphorylase n=1 Tax=Rhodopila sp. TaxID=2480087 RepID=UPI002C3FCA78|nr:RES family NAD+ phosphorylase [Rhodopila sp.]HVZ08245.1 RES family NAD+ phosphorylase [Rhodopila sp.]
MQLWRLCRRPYADLSGEGARRYGGRWNSRGRPVVYLADHPALAALEVRVHLDLPYELLPDDYALMGVSIPDALIEDGVPGADTQAIGDAWLTQMRSAALRVPSVLTPKAWNVLLNPRHADAGQAVVTSVEPFGFDPRLWGPLAGKG